MQRWSNTLGAGSAKEWSTRSAEQVVTGERERGQLHFKMNEIYFLHGMSRKKVRKKMNGMNEKEMGKGEEWQKQRLDLDQNERIG